MRFILSLVWIIFFCTPLGCSKSEVCGFVIGKASCKISLRIHILPHPKDAHYWGMRSIPIPIARGRRPRGTIHPTAIRNYIRGQLQLLSRNIPFPLVLTTFKRIEKVVIGFKKFWNRKRGIKIISILILTWWSEYSFMSTDTAPEMEFKIIWQTRKSQEELMVFFEVKTYTPNLETLAAFEEWKQIFWRKGL
jgi:hypothetical protein